MQESEFDKFAEEYLNLHRQNIKASGEDPIFFARYKIADLKQLAKQAHLRNQPRILDFGAGIGNSIPHFREFFPDVQLTCLDVSKKSLNIAEERFGSVADYVHFDSKKIPYSDDTFDLCFTACVFHHIPMENHIPLLKEIYRTLKPGSFFVIFEHNPYNPLTVHAVNTCPLDENAVLIKASQLKNSLGKAGFKEISITYRIFFPAFLRALRRLEKYLGSIPLGAQYYASCKKSV